MDFPQPWIPGSAPGWVLEHKEGGRCPCPPCPGQWDWPSPSQCPSLPLAVRFAHPSAHPCPGQWAQPIPVPTSAHPCPAQLSPVRPSWSWLWGCLRRCHSCCRTSPAARSPPQLTVLVRSSRRPENSERHERSSILGTAWHGLGMAMGTEPESLLAVPVPPSSPSSGWVPSQRPCDPQ